MIVCENSGEYKAYVLDSPLGNQIEAVVATENGFLIATEHSFLVYTNSTSDDRVPLRKVGERSQILMSHDQNNFNALTIESMCLNEQETCVYVITSQAQMIKGSLDIANFQNQATETRFEY